MTVAQIKSRVTHPLYQVTWEKLPEDYPLPDSPGSSTSHPLLAAALRDNLEFIGLLTTESLVGSNLGICATVNDQTILKAPDWFYVPTVFPLDPPRARRSYTPGVEGEIPVIVMEFLSATDGGEYSSRPFHPYGKLWFYERILQVPIYVIFEPERGNLEVRQLRSGSYHILNANAQERYWIESINLYLGVWYGRKADRTGYWLRWWDGNDNMLLWGGELLEQERQRVEKLKSYLRSQGIDPEQIL